MPKDFGFIKRFTSDKPFLLPPEAFPPNDTVETVPVVKADHMRPTDFSLWLTHEGRSRCYPWWIADNYHMINDVIGGDPVWVAL